MNLKGIVPPLVTPFAEGEEIDVRALRADVEYMVEEAAIDGIVVGVARGRAHPEYR